VVTVGIAGLAADNSSLTLQNISAGSSYNITASMETPYLALAEVKPNENMVHLAGEIPVDGLSGIWRYVPEGIGLSQISARLYAGGEHFDTPDGKLLKGRITVTPFQGGAALPPVTLFDSAADQWLDFSEGALQAGDMAVGADGYLTALPPNYDDAAKKVDFAGIIAGILDARPDSFKIAYDLSLSEYVRLRPEHASLSLLDYKIDVVLDLALAFDPGVFTYDLGAVLAGSDLFGRASQTDNLDTLLSLQEGDLIIRYDNTLFDANLSLGIRFSDGDDERFCTLEGGTGKTAGIHITREQLSKAVVQYPYMPHLVLNFDAGGAGAHARSGGEVHIKSAQIKGDIEYTLNLAAR
jgi:hypothetical protein